MGFGGKFLEVFGHSRRALTELPESILITKTSENRELLQQMREATEASAAQRDQFSRTLQQRKQQKTLGWTRFVSTMGFGNSKRTAQQTIQHVKQSKADLKQARKTLKQQQKAERAAVQNYTHYMGEVTHQHGRMTGFVTPYEEQVRLAQAAAQQAPGDTSAQLRLTLAEEHLRAASVSRNAFQEAMDAHRRFTSP